MKTKIAVSVPADVLRRARAEVRRGRAGSLSAYVSEALAEKAKRDGFIGMLDQMDREFGPPTREHREWARRVLGR